MDSNMPQVTLESQLRNVTADLNVAREFLSHLPRTLDGLVIVPGAVLWLDDGGKLEQVRIISVTDVAAGYVPNVDGYSGPADMSAPADWFAYMRETHERAAMVEHRTP